MNRSTSRCAISSSPEARQSIWRFQRDLAKTRHGFDQPIRRYRRSAERCVLFDELPAQASDFWGGVPDGLRSLYTVNMFLAAAGYFPFTFFLIYRLKPTTRGGGRVGLGTFNALYALILIPSALWMPLTFAMLEAPSDGLWWAIRLNLAAVGIGSLGLLAALMAVHPRSPSVAHELAIAGNLAFSCQTAILDALAWPVYFPV